MVAEFKEKEVKVIQRVPIKYMEQSDFIDFLSRKGILPIFVANLVRHHTSYFNIKHPFERLFELNWVREVVDGSFTWAETPEGHDFWKNVAKEWKEKCEVEGVENTWASE